MALYPVVIVYGMVGAGVLCVPNPGSGLLILCATLGVSGVSTIGGYGSFSIRVGVFCSTLGGAPDLFRRY